MEECERGREREGGRRIEKIASLLNLVLLSEKRYQATGGEKNFYGRIMEESGWEGGQVFSDFRES